MTDSQDKAFPVLNLSEISALSEWGEEEAFQDGAFLIREGQVGFPFYVVLDGEVRIEECSSGEVQQVTVHRAGEFTGDVDMLTGRPAFVNGVAQGGCRALRIEANRLRDVLNAVPSLGDKFLEAFQGRRFLLERSQFRGIQVVGDPQQTQSIRVFLYKNSAPFTWIEPDDQQARIPGGVDSQRLPAVVCGQERILHRPTLRELAECIGILRPIPEEDFDLVVVGAGPAGLAAAVYAASEGLSTLVLDRLGPGGQAGTTSKIENFIGFPSGLSGGELASRTYLQILKFGGIVSAPVDVKSLECGPDRLHRLHLDDGSRVRTHCVLVATGVKYRRLPIPGILEFEDAGVYYAATSVESRVCRNQAVAVVGAGNSAGQAAMYLSEQAGSVKLLVRGDDLEKSMSNYLAERIRRNPRIEVLLRTELQALEGDGHLSRIDVLRKESGDQRRLDCKGLFIFIGSVPNTDWLPSSVELDKKGYVITGQQAGASDKWPLDRLPCALETTAPGIFAAGDVRNQATRRVAFAAGDGALAVSCVHQYRSMLSR